MTPFEPGILPTITSEEFAAKYNCTVEEAKAALDQMSRSSIAMNDTHQVNISKIKAPFGPANGDIWWLSIKRRDKSPIHDWRELQTIKNMLVGAENEGFEIYPAESRLVDTSNQYHLWVFDNPKVRLPVGWQEREILSPEDAAKCGAVQRPFGVTR